MSSTTIATSPDTLTYTTPIHTLATSADARSPLGDVATVMPDRRSPMGYHCATNGRTLAIVPFSFPSTVDTFHQADPSIRLVPGKVIKGVKAIKGTRTLDTFSNGSSTGSDGTAHDGSPHSFPHISGVLNGLKDGGERVVISLNAKLLYELALALGSDGSVSLHCDPKGRKASVVVPIDGSESSAVGVMMPIMGNDGRDSTNTVYERLTFMASRFAAVGR